MRIRGAIVPILIDAEWRVSAIVASENMRAMLAARKSKVNRADQPRAESGREFVGDPNP
jgi:hypothetical protein